MDHETIAQLQALYGSGDEMDTGYDTGLPMSFMPAQPVNLIGASDEIQVPTNFSQMIQEKLGTRQPDPGGMAQDILSSRFTGNGTSFGDYASGIVKSALGTPTLGPDIGMTRINEQLKQMQALQTIDTGQARADLYRKGGTGTNGATMQIIQGLMQSNPGMTFDQALYQYQTGNRQGTQLTPSGISITPGTLSTNEAIANSKKLGSERADVTVDKEKRLPGATGALSSSIGGSKAVFDSIAKAKKQSGAFTTGFLGSMTKSIPGTPSYDLARTIDTVKANIGFDKLAQMRAMSPTGGALGQVSDFENRLLQSTMANLEQSQTRQQFEDNLDRVNQQYTVSMQRLRDAYINDFGETEGFDRLFSQIPTMQTNQGNDSGLTPQEQQELDSLRARFNGR